jgi:hypothetical protein
MIDQGLSSLRRISISQDVYTIHPLSNRGSARVWAEDGNLKATHQPLRKLMHEGGLGISHPSWVSGRYN